MHCHSTFHMILTGLTAIDAFGLRYIPIAIVAIIAPIALWIRTRYIYYVVLVHVKF